MKLSTEYPENVGKYKLCNEPVFFTTEDLHGELLYYHRWLLSVSIKKYGFTIWYHFHNIGLLQKVVYFFISAAIPSIKQLSWINSINYNLQRCSTEIFCTYIHSTAKYNLEFIMSADCFHQSLVTK